MTSDTQTKLTVDGAYKFFEEVLDVNGYTTLHQKKLLRL